MPLKHENIQNYPQFSLKQTKKFIRTKSRDSHLKGSKGNPLKSNPYKTKRQKHFAFQELFEKKKIFRRTKHRNILKISFGLRLHKSLVEIFLIIQKLLFFLEDCWTEYNKNNDVERYFIWLGRENYYIENVEIFYIYLSHFLLEAKRNVCQQDKKCHFFPL